MHAYTSVELKRKINDFSNIPQGMRSSVGKNLHTIPNHPLTIIKNIIFEYFDSLTHYKFAKFEDLSPIVTIEQNFDDLLIPKDHPAR